MSAISPFNTKNNYLFLPTQIQGCALWLDAADTTTITTNGTTLIAWNDKSGKTTTTINSAPTLSGNFINTFQTLRFNNNQIQATLASAIGTGDYALFAVWLTINGGTEVVLSIGSNGTNAAIGYNGTYYNLFEWGQSESDYTAAKNQYVVHSGTRTSSVKTCFVNGNAAPTASGALNLTDSNIYIGNSGFAINGEIAEIIVYSNTISASQRQQVEGYLAWKWSIQTNLPSSHPYYNNPYLSNVTLTNYFPSHMAPSAPLYAPPYSGLLMWLDAADTTSITFLPGGGGVSNWRDKSGNGNSGVTYNNYPTYVYNYQNNLNVIKMSNAQFGGPFYGPGTTVVNNTSLQVFAVASVSNATQNLGRILSLGNTLGFDSNNNSNYYPLAVSSGTSNLVIGISSSAYQLGVPIPAYNSFFLAQSYTSTNIEGISINGATPSTLIKNFSTNYYIYRFGIGGQSFANDFFYSLFYGYIAEILVYSNYFTTAQRQQVEGYLANKWGLVSNLPSTHPYYAPSVGNFNVPKNVTSYVYSPKSISGLALWLDAADSTTFTFSSGCNIQVWKDKSTNNYTVNQTTVSNQPVATSFGVQLNSNIPLYFNTTYTAFPPSETIFYVMNYTSWISNTEIELFHTTATGGRQLYIYNNNLQTAQYGNTNLLTAGVLVSNTVTLTESTNDGSTIYHYVNGSIAGSNSVTPYSGSGNTVIGARNVPDRGLNGFIYEIVTYNTILTQQQRQQVEGYLAWKWKLQSSLPSSHPYYLFPP